MARLPGTQTRSQRSPAKSTAEEKLIEMLERELAESRKANAKLLRMVEMVMEERFYRPTITGGVRQNVQTSGLPLESLNDVTVFDEDVDAADSAKQQQALMNSLREIETEHKDWRAKKGLEDESATADTAAA